MVSDAIETNCAKVAFKTPTSLAATQRNNSAVSKEEFGTLAKLDLDKNVVGRPGEKKGFWGRLRERFSRRSSKSNANTSLYDDDFSHVVNMSQQIQPAESASSRYSSSASTSRRELASPNILNERGNALSYRELLHSLDDADRDAILHVAARSRAQCMHAVAVATSLSTSTHQKQPITASEDDKHVSRRKKQDAPRADASRRKKSHKRNKRLPDGSWLAHRRHKKDEASREYLGSSNVSKPLNHKKVEGRRKSIPSESATRKKSEAVHTRFKLEAAAESRAAETQFKPSSSGMPKIQQGSERAFFSLEHVSKAMLICSYDEESDTFEQMQIYTLEEGKNALKMALKEQAFKLYCDILRVDGDDEKKSSILDGTKKDLENYVETASKLLKQDNVLLAKQDV